MNIKRKLVIGTTAVAVAAFGGGAYAATQSSAGDSRQAFLNDVAKRLNVSPSVLNQALLGAFGDQLQAAVKAGRLTQAQANQIKQRAQQTGQVPFGGPGPGPGGFGGPGGYGGFRGPGGPDGPGALAGVASYLGLTPFALRDQLASGKSLAQIATAQHKSVPGLKDAITKELRARLDKAVAAKLLTSAQEQKILGGLASRVDGLVNRTGFGGRFRGRGLMGHAERFGAGGPPPADGLLGTSAPPPGAGGPPPADGLLGTSAPPRGAGPPPPPAY